MKNFFVNDKLLVWPKKEKNKLVVLNELFLLFEKNKTYTEQQVNEILKKKFIDFALLRRALVDYGYLKRTVDGKIYIINENKL